MIKRRKLTKNRKLLKKYIPNEIWIEIILFLDMKDIYNLLILSKRFYNLCFNKYIIKKFIHRYNSNPIKKTFKKYNIYTLKRIYNLHKKLSGYQRINGYLLFMVINKYNFKTCSIEWKKLKENEKELYKKKATYYFKLKKLNPSYQTKGIYYYIINFLNSIFNWYENL